MILCDYNQRASRIKSVVQTLAKIEDSTDLEITSVEPTKDGFDVKYKYYWYGEWYDTEMTIFNCQLILVLSFIQS